MPMTTIQKPLTLNDENFSKHAATLYVPSCCSIEDFFADVARFEQLKLDLTRCLKADDEDKPRTYRILINRIVVLFNDFSPKSQYLMFWSVRKKTEHIIALRTVLTVMGFFNQDVMAITPDLIIDDTKYPVDTKIKDTVIDVTN